MATTDSLLLPLWDWATCLSVPDALLQFHNDSTHPILFFAVLEPRLCCGFLQRHALPYQICFFLNDFMLVLVIFQREFLWRCSKCCQRWISLLKGAPVAISFCNKKDEEVQLSSARGENKITHSHSFLIIFSLFPMRPRTVSFDAFQHEERKEGEIYEVLKNIA